MGAHSCVMIRSLSCEDVATPPPPARKRLYAAKRGHLGVCAISTPRRFALSSSLLSVNAGRVCLRRVEDGVREM